MQNNFYSFFRWLFALIILSLSLCSCGVWTNFTTFFNLYYDAHDLFSQAEDDINKRETDIFSEQDSAVSTSTSALLEKVEEKCSKILQFHAESSYIDNSLFMIGKCFYYLGDYRKALRKFEELIATQPKSSLVLETRLWIGKTQMRLKDFDNSLTTLKDTREEAIKQNEREIAQNTFIEEIRYQIFKKDYSASIDLAKGFLIISKNDVLNAEVAFEIGKLYNKLNDYNDAIVYFKKVSDYSPTYDLKFNSLIEQGKVLREIGENDKALEIFNQLSRQQKYADALDQIDFEIGETYLKMDKVEKAVDQFIYVDTSFSKSPSAGKSAYELGKIFLDNYKNFDSAAYYFNRVFSSTAPSDYINLANSSSDQLRKYEILYIKVQDNSKQLSYALDSTAFIKDSIVYYTELEKKMRAARADSLKNKDNRVSSTSADSLKNKDNRVGSISNLTNQNNNQQQAQQPGLQQPQQQGQQQTGQLPQGSQQQQTGQLPQGSQQQQPGQLPQGSQQQQPGQQQSQSPQLLSQWNQLKSQSKPPVRPKTSIDTLTNELVKSEFELGNLMLFEFNVPDSAYKYYSDIMLNYPVSPYEGRVVFAFGNYYLAVNDTVRADSIFNVVYVKYKDEDIVNAAAIKLNKPLINLEYDPTKTLYVEAESLMTNSKYDSSITNMYKIYLTHPKSPFASKALYAIGWMLENKNMNDSAAVIYDTLTKEYPRSIYAADVLPKLTFYKNEIVRLNKAKQDSLYALTRPKSDTLSTDSLFIKKQKLGGLASNLNGGNNAPGNTAPNNAKAENNFINNNAVVNPDTLIRNMGRGIRRISR
jgi:TolA-binding protein